MEATSRRTLVAPVRVEPPKIKGSRFVGDAAPIDGDTAALGFVDEVREREPDASHHCWAFRLASGRARSSDDGEPGGTAGEPILRRIHGAELSDVVVVVTRWFGGTKLGTGGLVRAYGGCAAAVLEAAEIVEREIRAAFRLAFPYDLTAPVEAELARVDARVVDAEYAADVTLTVSVPIAAAAAFPDALLEATAGRVVAGGAS